MYQCFHCGQMSVVWDWDFDANDYGFEVPGVIHNCHCTNCGAEIEYRILEDNDESRADEVSSG